MLVATCTKVFNQKLKGQIFKNLYNLHWGYLKKILSFKKVKANYLNVVYLCSLLGKKNKLSLTPRSGQHMHIVNLVIFIGKLLDKKFIEYNF